MQMAVRAWHYETRARHASSSVRANHPNCYKWWWSSHSPLVRDAQQEPRAGMFTSQFAATPSTPVLHT